MVAEPGERLAEVAARYVCVKVLDMSRVDLDVYRFDYDLTFAALLMHGDGTILHRFGSRDARDPTHWNDLAGLARVMERTLDEHGAHETVNATDESDPRRVIDLEPLAGKWRTNARLRAGCVHCHTVHETLHRGAVLAGTADADTPWVYPPPKRIGLELDASDHAIIREVRPESPAAQAGLQAGDRLLQLGVQSSVLTIGDLSFALHEAAAGETRLLLRWRRGDTPHEGALDLPSGWKRGSVAEYAWRPYKWGLSPAPGFGGKFLSRADARELGIDDALHPFRVTYLVTWGDRAHRGRAAARAGLRSGDIVLRFAGRGDFGSMDDFHAFVRLTHRVGEEVEVEYVRDGERHTLRYALPK